MANSPIPIAERTDHHPLRVREGTHYRQWQLAATVQPLLQLLEKFVKLCGRRRNVMSVAGVRASEKHMLRLARLSEYEAAGLAEPNAGDACFAAANAKLLAFTYRVEQDLDDAMKQGTSRSECMELGKTYLAMLRQAGRYRQMELHANDLRNRTSGVGK